MIREAGMPTQTRPPKQGLGKLPTRLGPWIAEKLVPNPRTFPNAGAEAAVSRLYRNAAGETVSVYAAVWLKYDIPTPHPPEGCYRASGYETLVEDDVQLQVGRHRVPQRLLLLERHGQRVCVLYSYQLGDRVFVYDYWLRRPVWTLRGEREGPPLVKVMLETSASDPQRARARLESIAAPLLAWTREL